MDGASYTWYEYRVIEFLDEHGSIKFWLCQTYMNGKPYGPSFDARTEEERDAWMNLYIRYQKPKNEDDGGHNEGAAA